MYSLEYPVCLWVFYRRRPVFNSKVTDQCLEIFLNSLPLSHMQRIGQGYHNSQSWFITWDTLCELKLSSGMCPISNQPVAGSIMVNARTVRLCMFPSSSLVLMINGPMQSTHTVCQGLISRSRCGCFPYLVFVRLASWQSLHVVHSQRISLDMLGQ